MKKGLRTYIVFLLTIASFTIDANPQSPDPNRTANRKIAAYIDSGWNRLSRSMTDCKSLVDPKVTTAPVLYLPYGMATPSAVASAHQQCNVEVRNLPRTITHIGDVRVAEIPVEGLLYLPNRYVVPGGRFNEMYGWDSYFIILGLVGEGKEPDWELAQGMVENFFFEIENYGAILNANRTYFFTRSQPPFLTSMIREIYEHPVDKHLTKEWLAKAYNYAQRDYELWTSPIHRAGDTGLARFQDIGEGPVPEMADDSGYYPDVIRWLLAHPDVLTNYLVDAPDDPTAAEAASLATVSCDLTASKVCARAHVDGHRLTAAFYRGDRAMRESGFDPSARFGPFSVGIVNYNSVDLNSLLYRMETDLAAIHTLLDQPRLAEIWSQRAATRAAAIRRLMWDDKTGLFADYNFVTGQRLDYPFLSTFYPLWAGFATPEEAAAVAANLPMFEKEGGLQTSTNVSGNQWDAPFGWAPLQIIAIEGLRRYGFDAAAERLSLKFLSMILRDFDQHRTIKEKYNVVEAKSDLGAGIRFGYTSNEIGFGWTNAAFVLLWQDLSEAGKRALETKCLTH